MYSLADIKLKRNFYEKMRIIHKSYLFTGNCSRKELHKSLIQNPFLNVQGSTNLVKNKTAPYLTAVSGSKKESRQRKNTTPTTGNKNSSTHNGKQSTCLNQTTSMNTAKNIKETHLNNVPGLRTAPKKKPFY